MLGGKGGKVYTMMGEINAKRETKGIYFAPFKLQSVVGAPPFKPLKRCHKEAPFYLSLFQSLLTEMF